jgi:hypothetical protein
MQLRGDAMKIQADTQTGAYEQMLIRIVRTLPPERIAQLVDFARFLRSQVAQSRDADWLNEEEESEDQVRASEEKWDELLAKPEAQRAMVAMAREAREDFQAGRTTDITITEDGRLAPK